MINYDRRKKLWYLQILLGVKGYVNTGFLYSLQEISNEEYSNPSSDNMHGH